jgi:hypothetical protein
MFSALGDILLYETIEAPQAQIRKKRAKRSVHNEDGEFRLRIVQYTGGSFC